MAEETTKATGDVPDRPRTYDEIINDAWLSEAEQLRAKADSLLGHMAALTFQRGDLEDAQLLLQVRNAVIEYDGQRENDLWLEFDPRNYVGLTEEIQGRLRAVFQHVAPRLNYDVAWLGFRETMPRIGPDWRTQLQNMLNGDRPNNQARRTMPAKPQYTQDGLAFTNTGEQRVYQALKYVQEKELPAEETISIFPLPNGRVPGHTWEPDLLVTYRGRVGVLEIDGPSHRVRRAMDTSRDHLLRDAGVAYVDRIPVEVIDEPNELMAALKRFLRRLREGT
ncbi:hypothetical protein ACH4JZ_00755 [Streptomyces sp. NPDC017615]|uniref:hypothetical protein n=1 Tax=Streptomyces sp. NPDC017615 TaxID=3365003 RepID=UPI0037ACC15A